jgi:alanyl-tRNA synthetase
VEFVCGGRAVADYRRKHDVVTQLGATLTTGLDDLPAALARVQDEARQLRLELKRERGARLALEAAQLLAAAEPLSGARLVMRVLAGREVDEARQLANLLTAGGAVALLGVAGERAQLVLGRPAEGPAFAHMGEAIKPALAALGGARGGGGAVSAQGGGPAADEATVAAALAAAAAWLRATANAVELGVTEEEAEVAGKGRNRRWRHAIVTPRRPFRACLSLPICMRTTPANWPASSCHGASAPIR